ncbi:MAG: MerR family transcriptional regulator [Acidimicrobiales bacterium]
MAELHTMTIGELAARAGVSTSALRFWEAEGLVAAPERTPSGYRRYDEESLARVRFILRGQALGLSLAEIARLLAAADAGDGASVQEQLRDQVAGHLDGARRQVAELEGFVGQLERVYLRLGPGAGCGCTHLGDCECLPPKVS